MAGDATKVQMGVCNVTFNAQDLGYTKGGVKVKYSAESTPKEVDQLDTPIDEIITKQTFEVTVPMAEADLTRLATLLPGATLITDGQKLRLDLSGAAGTSLAAMGAELIITPVGGAANDKITLHKAVPTPNLEFAFEKENVRVYEVTFKAIPDGGDWVTFGDVTATTTTTTTTTTAG